MSESQASNLVQPILVSKTGSHAGTIACAALASYMVSQEPLANPEAYSLWLSGRFTKSVRRGSTADINKAILWAKETGRAHNTVIMGESMAVAFDPMLYEDYPRIITRAQVSGTDFPREPWTDSPWLSREDRLKITLLNTLTTGKAAAQGAHAFWMHVLASEGTPLFDEWTDGGTPLSLDFVPADALATLASASGHVAVVDSGLTEVDPSTLTATAAWEMM